MPKLASVPVVAQHADYGDNVFYDGAATSAGPDGVFVNFDDGDVYGWTGEDAGAKVRRKVLVRGIEETPEPGTKLLVVAAHYGRGPMRYHKWVRAEAVAPAAEDEKPAAWTLTSFCRHAFRHPEALEGYAVGMDATSSANAGSGPGLPAATVPRRGAGRPGLVPSSGRGDGTPFNSIEKLLRYSRPSTLPRAASGATARQRPTTSSSRPSGASRCSSRTATNGCNSSRRTQPTTRPCDEKTRT